MSGLGCGCCRCLLCPINLFGYPICGGLYGCWGLTRPIFCTRTLRFPRAWRGCLPATGAQRSLQRGTVLTPFCARGRFGGGGATDKPLQFAGTYQNIDLTVNARDYADSSTASRTDVGFEFDVDGDGKIDTAKGDQTVTFGIAEGNRIQTRGGTLLSWKTPYDLNAAEKAQLTITAEEVAAGNEDGLDLRVIRYGTMIYLFIENRQVT